jgi:UDPglucose 6-dehydrogenase
MKLTIFGSGYVGLVTGACLADVGHNVLCVDLDKGKIDGLKNGVIPIYEPGLEGKIKDNLAEGRIDFTTDAAAAIEHADVIFIAVGTPPDEDGSADLSAVRAVARTIGMHMNRAKLVVTKSTVPVGSSDTVREELQNALAKRNENIEFYVASNPEFLKEGAAISDFEKPDRIVVGFDNPKAEEWLDDIYAPFNRRNDRMVKMDIRSAELTKYAANAMLATKISFMNEMANIAERVGADIENVRLGIGSDERIGYHFIYPGVGYGGSCFPKDVKALAATARKHNFPAKIIEAVEAVNENQKNVLVEKIKHRFGNDLGGMTYALWGLAFKPNTDDMREAPSRVIMESLWRAGAKIKAYDAQAMEESQRIYGDRDDLHYCDHYMDCLDGADALIIVTEWKEFRAVNIEKIKSKLNLPVIFDGRNIYDPDNMINAGVEYYSIGRRQVQ